MRNDFLRIKLLKQDNDFKNNFLENEISYLRGKMKNRKNITNS